MSRRECAAAHTASREAEIRTLAATGGRRLMSDGIYSTFMLGWEDVRVLLDELDRIREVHRAEQRRSADRLRECLETK